MKQKLTRLWYVSIILTVVFLGVSLYVAIVKFYLSWWTLAGLITGLTSLGLRSAITRREVCGVTMTVEVSPKIEEPFSVGHCARCGGDHTGLTARPLSNHERYTHFVMCPSTDEPILIILHRDEKTV